MGVVAGLCLLLPSLQAQEVAGGPLVHEFSLTLEPGNRWEALGPFWGCERSGSQIQWGGAPLVYSLSDTNMDLREMDGFYPLCTYRRFGAEYRLQLFQIVSFSGGQTQAEVPCRRVTFFPFYFQQRSVETNRNYTAVVPIYGEIKDRFYRDNIRFTLFPLYVQTRKREVVTDNYLFPLFHRRQGPGLQGWQLLPLAGYEHQGILVRTNSAGEAETTGGHEKLFALWPMFFNQTTGIGTENPQRFRAVLPLFTWQRSPERDSTTCLWPLFTVTEDRARHYREWDVPWPFIVFARGEGKTANRVWPLFSNARNANLESDFYLWPLYKFNRFKSEALERERTRIFFFLYSDLIERSPEARIPKLQRTTLWPLFTAWREQDGSERLQVLALLEAFWPGHKKIERNYSSLWSIWRSEKNGKTGAASQSLLWNLYRQDTTQTSQKRSFLFGLFQYHADPEGRRWRLFYLPEVKAKPAKAPQTKS